MDEQYPAIGLITFRNHYPSCTGFQYAIICSYKLCTSWRPALNIDGDEFFTSLTASKVYICKVQVLASRKAYVLSSGHFHFRINCETKMWKSSVYLFEVLFVCFFTLIYLFIYFCLYIFCPLVTEFNIFTSISVLWLIHVQSFKVYFNKKKTQKERNTVKVWHWNNGKVRGKKHELKLVQYLWLKLQWHYTDCTYIHIILYLLIFYPISSFIRHSFFPSKTIPNI